MELWNDYEGKLLDGQYRLERLIGPKGRSAFFTTTDAGGRPATVRVIESLNDEDEILARWNAVRGIADPGLLQILACNKTVLDGVHLVYAVIEPTDAVLADLLRERALTPDETRDVAASIVGALEALHARGLVHEHVDAESVFAQGEAVKLREDCVREAPEGAEGETLRRRDAHDLAMLVGYALTQRRDSGQARLARPFDDFVRNGMTGTWGLREMGNAVRPLVPKTVAVAASAAAAAGAPGMSAGNGASGRPVAPASVAPVGVAAASVAAAKPATGGSIGAPQGAMQRVNQGVASATAVAAGPRPVAEAGGATGTSARSVAESLAAGGTSAERIPTRRVVGEDRIVLEPEESAAPRRGLWAGIAAAAVLLIGLIWYFVHGHGSTAPATAAATAGSTVGSAAPAGSAVSGPVAMPSKPSAATLPGGRGHVMPRAAGGTSAGPVQHGAGPAGSQWRVVAFTYNREEQAQQKATAIARVHPELKPEVFTPTGRAPYLVALGGWMSVDQAKSLREKARGEGLPHDIYAQNYRGH